MLRIRATSAPPHFLLLTILTLSPPLISLLISLLILTHLSNHSSSLCSSPLSHRSLFLLFLISLVISLIIPLLISHPSLTRRSLPQCDNPRGHGAAKHQCSEGRTGGEAQHQDNCAGLLQPQGNVRYLGGYQYEHCHCIAVA